MEAHISTKHASPAAPRKKIPGTVSFEKVPPPGAHALLHQAGLLEARAVTSNAEAVLHKQWVLKQSRWIGQWRWRWLVLNSKWLRFYARADGEHLGDKPTEEFPVRLLQNLCVLSDEEVGPSVARSTPLSCMLDLEPPPEPMCTIVRIHTNRSLLLFAVAPSSGAANAAGILATLIVNASIAERTDLPQYRTPGMHFSFEPRGLVKLRGRYSIGNEIGRGCYGTVYRARCLQSGRAVAIKKVMLVGGATTAVRNPVRERVLREVEILREVRSPYVVELLDYIEEGLGMGCLVMELLPGGDLYTQVAQRYFPTRHEAEPSGDAPPLPRRDQPHGYSESDVQGIMRMALSGLEVIHDLKIVHRDLKPENVLLIDRRGGLLGLKIADFGLACRLAGRNGSIPGHEAIGTRGYMAPEVVSATVHSLPADIWSMGVILFTLLCGRLPFFHEDEAVEEEAVCEGRWSFVHPNWDEVSFGAKDTVRKLLSHAPYERPTAHEALALPWMMGNGLAGSDYGDARLQSPTSRGSGSGDASAASGDSCSGGSGPASSRGGLPGSLPGSASLLELSVREKQLSHAHVPQRARTVSHTNLEKRHRTALAEMVSDGMASLDGTFDDMLDDQLEVRELHGAFEPPHAHQPQTAADAAAEPTTQPRPLSRSHMLSGTDEHGLRVRMFTASLTCGRAVKAGLDKFRYVGEATEKVPTPRVPRRGVAEWTIRQGKEALGGSGGESSCERPPLPLTRGAFDREALDRLGLVRHGQGRIVYDSGNVYDGQWEHDKRSGVGRFEYACGDVYEGEWSMGMYHGQGKYTGRQHGSDEYEGEWEADKPHGHGRYLYRDSGDVYDGQWVRGMRDGEGRIITPHGQVYEGLYECGERVRVALSKEHFLAGADERGVRIRIFTAAITCERITKADLAKAWYEGESYPSDESGLVIAGRVRHGHGEMHHDCGNVYVGQFEHDQRSGRGTYTYACGDVYVGEWKDGMYHGEGSYTGSPNGGGGDSYEGEWQADKPHGHGRYTYAARGDVYDGQWVEGRCHGVGRYISADGVSKDGEWREGLLLPVWQRGGRV